MDFKIVEVDEGFCQVTYETKNSKGERIYYGLQEHFGIRLVRCSRDYEPQWEAKLRQGFFARENFERTPGKTRLEKLCNKWIENN